MEEADRGGLAGEAKAGAIAVRSLALTSDEQQRVKAIQRLVNAPDRRRGMATILTKKGNIG